MTYDVAIKGKKYRLELNRVDGRWQCRLDGREIKCDAVLTQKDVLSVLIESKAYEIKRERTVSGVRLWVRGTWYAAELGDPRSLRSRRDGAAGDEGPQWLVASMPGKVVRVLVGEGSAVEAGQGVVVVEAMKMQNEVKSPKKGVLRKLEVAEGANVNAGDVLAIVE